MFCGKCGFKIKEGNFYCTNCGVKIEECVNLSMIKNVELFKDDEVEQFVINWFTNMGYTISEIANKKILIAEQYDCYRIGIFIKCSSISIDKSYIQETLSIKERYELNKVIVVTNNIFTQSAIDLATYNDIGLWDKYFLKEKI